jgi:hypothetical protein
MRARTGKLLASVVGAAMVTSIALIPTKDLSVNQYWLEWTNSINTNVFSMSFGPGTNRLVSNYPSNLSAMVYHSYDLSNTNWTQFWVGPYTNRLRIWPTNQQEFFIVRYSNNISGIVSDWGQK